MNDTAAPLAVAPTPDDGEMPVEEVGPGDGEGNDSVQLVRTGWVRFRFGETTVRLRRPFLGELRDLRMALEDTSDNISEQAEEAQLIAMELITEGERIDGDESIELADRVRQRRALTRRSTEGARKLNLFREQAMVGWIRLAAERLSVDGELPPDEELPSWFIDPRLPATLLEHWRNVPLGRGR